MFCVWSSALGSSVIHANILCAPTIIRILKSNGILHLKLLASLGLHITFLANSEFVSQGESWIDLWPSEVITILGYLCSVLEVSSFLNLFSRDA